MPGSTSKQQSEREGSRLRDGAALLAAFALPFAVYLSTLCPSPPIGDSTEFALVFHFWGIPHATGYPLYVLLGGLWDQLPLGSVAYRANLLSAVLAAAACALVAWLYLALLCHRLAAVLAAWVTAFSSLFWSQAVIAEVYALHCLLVALVLVAFLGWQRTRSERSLVWLALAAGLALSHHRTAVFVAVPFMLAALIQQRPLRAALLGKAALAGLAPFLLYAYLPIRAQADPVVIWGDCKTWVGFWEYMRAAAFSHFIFGRQGDELLAFFGGALADAANALTWAGVALAGAGCVWLWWRNRLTAICSTIAFVLTAAWAGGYGAVDAPVFMVANTVFLGLWVAAGAQAAAVGIAALGRAAKSRRASAARWIVPAALILLPYNMLAANLNADFTRIWGLWYAKHLLRLNLSDYWEIYDIGQVLVAEPDPGSVVVLQGHGSYTIALYLQLVEGRRPDLTFVSRELAHHDYYRRVQKDRRLRAIMDEAREVFNTGVLGEEGDWGRIMLSVMASRLGNSPPLFTNADTSLLPPGCRVLQGAAAGRVLTGDPQAFVTRDVPQPSEAQPLAFGVSLSEGEPLLPSVLPGAVLPLQFKWVCSRAVEYPLQAVIWLTAPGGFDAMLQAHREGRANTAWIAEWKARSITEARPLAYGIVPLDASPPGTCYQQTAYLVVPRFTPASGEYEVLVSLETEDVITPPASLGTIKVRR